MEATSWVSTLVASVPREVLQICGSRNKFWRLPRVQTVPAPIGMQSTAMHAVLEPPLGAYRPRRGSARLPLLMQHLRRPTVCQMDASFAALDRAVQARDPKHCTS